MTKQQPPQEHTAGHTTAQALTGTGGRAVVQTGPDEYMILPYSQTGIQTQDTGEQGRDTHPQAPEQEGE